MATSHEQPMVPFPKHKLVLLTDDYGLEKVHIRTPEPVQTLLLECYQRYPHIKWLEQIANKPSHRYPESEKERQLAYNLGNLYIEINSAIPDPESVAQDALLVSAAISLSSGHIIDTQLLSAFLPLLPESLSAWQAVDLSGLDKIDRVKFSQRAKSWVEDFTEKKARSTHPVPETKEQKETAFFLRGLFEQLMWTLIVHDARNYAMYSAARLLQIGVIFPKSFDMVYEAYSGALGAARGARFSGKTDENETNDDEEDLSPYGTIS